MPEYRAFISYASPYTAWVAILRHNLEACLKQTADGGSAKVFLDQVDLRSGRSWVSQLQAGIDEAEQLVLVATPEAMASPRVEDEWEAFIAARRDWSKGRLHLILLVETPLPPFLAKMQHVDFRGHDETNYRAALRKLVSGLVGQSTRDLPPLPQEIEIPGPPPNPLPDALRGKMIAWLAPMMTRATNRRALAAALFSDKGRTSLDDLTTDDVRANSVIVRASVDDDPIAAAIRILDSARRELEEDEPAHVTALAPIRAELEALGATSPGTGLLRTWLDYVRREHDRLVPYFQQQAETTALDRVYVSLGLRADASSLKRDAVSDLRLDRPLGLRDLLDLDPTSQPWVTRRWVVRGDPGAGKTTLLRHLAANLARETQPHWIPVFASLPRLMREREFLLDRLARQLEHAGHPAKSLPEVLGREATEGRLLLLLDGLDEVPSASRDEADALLRDLSERWRATPIVVSTRPIGYRSPGPEFVLVDLLPLDRDRRIEFLARWFGRATGTLEIVRAAADVTSLETDPTLWDLSGNPLYLTLIALLLEQGLTPAKNRTKLYDQVFKLLLEGKHRPEGEPIERSETVRRVIRHLAHEMTGTNLDAESVGQLEDRLYKPEADELRAELTRVPRWDRNLRTFLDELANRTGILAAHDGADSDWRFWHRTFREALAAERLEEIYRGKEGAATLLAHAKQIAGDESRWAEPYALLAGRVAQPDALVKALVGANRPLGLRALATATSISEATVAEILELTTDPDERGKVFTRIPELVDDPDRALKLIDRLRRTTTDGDDLYFLYEAALAVGRNDRWPDHADAARKLTGRFFDHLEPPPAELLGPAATIETPHDGRVSLWCTIPAGSLQMGSTEGVGHADEQPRHDVRIASPFRLGSVPITNTQYAAFDRGHTWHEWQEVGRDELASHPVVNVSWHAAVSFCRWLGARLPSEAEWEYACRAGQQATYWSGNDESDLADVGWYDKNSGGRTHRVGEKRANPCGLYDVHGNVWEWCEDTFQNSYADAPNDGSAWVAGGSGRVDRGGCFISTAVWARAACRNWDPPAFRSRDLGFRVVLPVARAADA